MSKTLGQVAYEAMLVLLRDDVDSPAHDPDWRMKQDVLDYGAWEAQPQKLRDDWEAVADAVRRAVTQ